MKPVTSWKFSAPVEDIDLPRIVKEAEDSCRGTARGIVRVTLPEAWVLLVDRTLTVGKFDLPAPDGYLTPSSKLEVRPLSGELGVCELESPRAFAPPSAVCVYRCATQNAADELLGKIVDRVAVTVEVF